MTMIDRLRTHFLASRRVNRPDGFKTSSGLERQTQIREQEYRESFPASVRRMADELRYAGFTRDQDAFEIACFKFAPDWFTTAMQDKYVGWPEGPWPQFARTSDRIDWIRLLDEHPDGLEVMEEELLANQYVPFSIFEDVWEAATARGLGPSLDTDLWMGERGQVQLWPHAISADSAEITAEDDRSIRSMIHASGYGDSLNPDTEPGLWHFY